MMNTPNTSFGADSSHSITPVRSLVFSPKQRQENDSNAAACKSRLDELIKSLLENYAKWQLAHKRGLSVCYSIEAIKTKSLQAVEAATKNNELDPPTLYPKELEPYCDRLCTISGIFLDIAANTRPVVEQLKALNRMSGMADKIFYRTWKLQQFIAFAEKISENYAHEAKIKQQVMTHLPHCTERSNLIQCTSAWEYPLYVDDSISLIFSFLKEEIDVDKK